MKKIVSQVWLGLVCVILGFMLTFQFKASRSVQSKTNSRNYEEMAKDLESLQKQKDDLNAKVKEYQDKVDQYEKAVADESLAAKKMKEEIDNLRILAGLTDVSGPGVVITISPPLDVTQSAYSYIPYDIILDIVNELNTTDEADAISINDERYTGRTQVREVGNIIKINDARIDPTQPIIIKAIGKQEVLWGAFTMPGSILEVSRGIGFEVDIKKQDNIQILKYSKSLAYKYIK